MEPFTVEIVADVVFFLEPLCFKCCDLGQCSVLSVDLPSFIS